MNKIEQKTFIYCVCGNELCSDGSFISDSYDENDDNHVLYKCKKCGTESDFNFDIAPCPINWKELQQPPKKIIFSLHSNTTSIIL